MTGTKEELLALCIESHTLMSAHPSPFPVPSGNHFSIRASNGNEYKIDNFNLENLEHLVDKGLTWPIKIIATGN